MKIKVCGMTDMGNLGQVLLLDPDYVGFIFHPKSPRFVENDTVFSTGRANELRTGVFVDAAAGKIADYIDCYRLDAIQLHGNESPGFCRHFKGVVKVIKAFGVDENFDFSQLDAYKDSVDFFLFDTKTPIHGGSGKSFDWALLNKYQLDIPFFLSGGLSLDNLQEVKHIKHPAFYGVDLNSRFETAPGVKDIDKLKEAFALLNK